MTNDNLLLNTTVPSTFTVPDGATCRQWDAMPYTLPYTDSGIAADTGMPAGDETVLQAADSIRWDDETHSFNANGPRPAFPDETQQKIRPEAGQDRCHYVSYKAIARSVSGVLNYAFQNNDADYLSDLWNLYSSVYWINNGPEQNEQDAAKCINELEELQLDDPSESAAYASQLVYALNASIGNLRAASSAWNRSVGAQFDPDRWIYALTADTAITESMRIVTIVDFTLIPGTAYLSSSMYDRLLPLEDMMNVSIPTIGVYSARSASLGKQYKYDGTFLFSSNNTFGFPGRMQAVSVPIDFADWI